MDIGGRFQPVSAGRASEYCGHRIGTGPVAYRILETLEKQYPTLVTSANHMPRAVAAFRKAGMDPIPAPTEYLAQDDYGLLGYLPTLKHLMCVNAFVYESRGMAWYKLKE